MKLLVVFILLPSLLFGQLTPIFHSRNDLKQIPDSLVSGDWYLSESVVLSETYSNYIVNKERTTLDFSYKKLSFSGDSLLIHPDTTLRFYMPRIERFAAQLSFDSLSGNRMQLFQGKKKKRREIDSYQIVHCSRSELVIRSTQHLNTGIDEAQFSIVYTYRREGVNELLNKLEGKWLSCADTPYSLLPEAAQENLLYFTRKIENSSCSSEQVHHLDLTFYRLDFVNMCSTYGHTHYTGGGYVLPFEIDATGNIIYFGAEEPNAYKIEFSDPESLTLSLIQSD